MIIKKYRGSALITALFIMTVIAIIVTSMISRQRIDIHHTKITIASDKSYLASQVVTYWAIESLKSTKKPLVAEDNYGKVLTFPTKYVDIYPEVKVSGYVYDLQAKFNLNNLVDEKYKPIFLKIIGKIKPSIKKQEREKIVAATANWVKGTPPTQTAHDEWLDLYLKKEPPYLPGYQFMRSITEFRSVYGVNAYVYNSLYKYISTLPETTPFNINTVPIKILKSLTQKSKEKEIQEIIRLRSSRPFADLSAIQTILKSAKIDTKRLSTTSNYFLVIAKAKANNITFTNYVTLKTIVNKDNSLRIDVIRQSFNTE